MVNKHTSRGVVSSVRWEKRTLRSVWGALDDYNKRQRRLNVKCPGEGKPHEGKSRPLMVQNRRDIGFDAARPPA